MARLEAVEPEDLMEDFEVSVGDGKYTIVKRNGRLSCLRYGEEWRDLTGDKMVLCMAMEIMDLRSKNSSSRKDQ